MADLFHMRLMPVSRVSHLVEDVRVARVEEERESLLDASDHLRPHRVNQEVIARHNISFVTGERKVAIVRASNTCISGKNIIIKMNVWDSTSLLLNALTRSWSGK